jgi:hypothetical protein
LYQQKFLPPQTNCAFSTAELWASESRTAKPPTPSVAEAGTANETIKAAAAARDRANLRNMGFPPQSPIVGGCA